MKKAILKILKWSLLFAYLFFMLGFASRKTKSLNCSEKTITINAPYEFVTEESVEKLLITNGINIDSCPIDKINFDQVEKVLEENPFIINAEIFSDFYGNLNIDITQRKPIMRIITNNNESYYLDETSTLMPVSENYTAGVIVASGNITKEFLTASNEEENQLNHAYSFTKNDLFNYVLYLNEHELWKYQIVQIYVNDEKEIELVPRVGNHIIILGNLENYKYKMGKLEAIYKKGLNLTDWNIYSSINLKYSNQVICKKR